MTARVLPAKKTKKTSTKEVSVETVVKKSVAVRKKVVRKPVAKAQSVVVKKIPSKLNPARILNGLLVSLVVFIVWTLVHASTPNPGHSWATVGDGTWAATGTSILRTFTFPDASATVMTTLDVKQGDILYGSAASTTAVLAKDTNATRYLSNTGASNNPAWSLINLVNGVNGILPSTNGGTGNASTTFTGQTVARTYTLPDANATILTTNAAVTVGQGGTGVNSVASGSLMVGNNTNAVGTIAPGVNGTLLISEGSVWKNAYPPSGFGVNGRRPHVLVTKNPALATVTSVYSAAPTLTATASNGDTAEGAFLNSSTTAVANNASGLISAAFTLTRFDWNPDFTVRIKTTTATTTTRFWIGLVSASPDGASASPAISMIGFRYDSAAQTTPFWQTITCTSTCVGTGSTTNTTSFAVTTDTIYKFRVNCTSTSSCDFYINDTFVANHTLDLPASTQNLGYAVRVQTLASSIRGLRTGYINITGKN
jgi:hypothetical protein